MDGEISPLFYNQVWIYDSNKTNPSWEQKVLLVMDKKLYFSTCVSFYHFNNYRITLNLLSFYYLKLFLIYFITV